MTCLNGLYVPMYLCTYVPMYMHTDNLLKNGNNCKKKYTPFLLFFWVCMGGYMGDMIIVGGHVVGHGGTSERYEGKGEERIS